LSDYPHCDALVQEIVQRVWGAQPGPTDIGRRKYGHGEVIAGGDLRCATDAAASERPIARAQWIWYPEGDPALAAPPAQRFFRHVFALEAGARAAAAILEMTADNTFQAWVNGRPALQGDNFHVVYRADVSSLLKSGENVLCLAATNGSDRDNPAGVIGALEIRLADGSCRLVTTDETWLSAQKVGAPDWYQQDNAGGDWIAARTLGAFNMSPWSLDPAAGVEPQLYPNYEVTAGLLSAAGVPPDFESDGSVRYTHRTQPDMDIYFVANRTNQRVAPLCTFRVSGCKPELWDPVDGTIRPLREFDHVADRTRVPLQFEPYQSYFVVFREQALASAAKEDGARNFPITKTVATIGGPWSVSFDQAAGGPGALEFAALEDWSQHPSAAVRHFSGIATYRRAFDLPGAVRPGQARIRLDLGTVHCMARVRLNGQDLGVVWTAPWSVDISKAVRDRDNQLEIDVANLWPNRLIGDAGLQPTERRSWTTWSPFQATDPLLPSGLLGPVTIVVAQ
jgi:hypothetical protein